MDPVKHGISIVALATLLAVGCDTTQGDEVEIRADGILGIELGMTFQDVATQIGAPTATGIGDGPWRSWYSAYYADSLYRGVKLMFENETGVPLESSILDRYEVEHPFNGATGLGIMVGSTYAQLTERYGEADGEIGLWEMYCVGTRAFQFLIEADSVARINVGFNKPLPQLLDCSK